jgi:hypothetical protein
VTAYLVPVNYPYLEYAVKREVITQVAQHCGLPLTIRDSSGPQELRRLPEVINRNIYRLSTGKRLFFNLVSSLGGLVSLFHKKKAEVLIYPEGIFHTPLFERYLERYEELGFRLIFPVTSIPPRSLMLEMIRKGTIPFYNRGSRGKEVIRKAVGKIRKNLESLMESPEWKDMWTIEGIDFSPVFSKIIGSVVLNDIEEMAVFAAGCGKEFERRGVDSIVLPSDRARVHRVLLEVARSKGVETFYFEHGLTKYQPVSSLNGKSGLVKRVICWGEKDRNALKALGIDSKRLVSFTPPFLADYIPPLSKHKGNINKVLLLEHCYTKDHINGITYAGEEFLLKLCRGLTEMGVKEIRFKVHPGMTIQAYFQRLIERQDLEVEVFKNEDLRSLILWSDLVIGPISTAVLEVILLGREYYCVDLEGLEWQGTSVFDGTISRIYSSTEEVLSAVKDREGLEPGNEEIRSICGVTSRMTREEALDPILDYFQDRCLSTPSIHSRVFEVTV